MMRKIGGFTLLEILIALFIFTILSLIFTSALHNVLTIKAETETKAVELNQLQLTLLMLSRDIEQMVNRQVTNASGQLDPAFMGTSKNFTFTHIGYANPFGTALQSTLQRTRYRVNQSVLYRDVWVSLDEAPHAEPLIRELANNIQEARFEYLSSDGKFYRDWPAKDATTTDQALPRAIRIHLIFTDGGQLSQLYVIPIQSIKKDVSTAPEV